MVTQITAVFWFGLVWFICLFWGEEHERLLNTTKWDRSSLPEVGKFRHNDTSQESN